MAELKILCVGALTLDHIYRLEELPAGPGKFLQLEAVQIASGMASNAATAARRQGIDVSLWASVGADANGHLLTTEMQREGIDCAYVRRVERGRSAIATIFVDMSGERLIVPFYDPVTHADSTGHSIPFECFGAVLADTRLPGAAEVALREARKLGIPAILDADVASKATLERLLPAASHIVASLPACRLVFGATIDAHEAARRLQSLYGVFAAVTDGENGTYFRDADDYISHLPAYRIDAVDTLAGGDVFHGVFAAHLAQTNDVRHSLAMANSAAAIKCLHFGGRLGAPTQSQTLKFMQDQSQ